ncbi:MAG: ABC transporter substrate-binding protein [Anaerolineales bacterium]
MKNLIRLALLLPFALAACGGGPQPTQARVRVRVGVLPILDALPMYVAEAQGYFAENGLEVIFVPVASAAERDQLMQAGQIDGMINDLISTMLYNKNQISVIAVRFARTATPEFPQYRILAPAGSGIATVEDLAGVEIGISEGTVIEYTTYRLLEAEGLATEDIRTVAVPKIPDRLALLASGELQAANLPDPLSSLAIQGGATVVIDDSAHPEYGNSLISFRKDFVTQRAQVIRGFLAAIEAAVADINADKTAWEDLLVERELIPAPLIGEYTIPDFPAASVPSEAQFADVLEWALDRGLVQTRLSYSQSVDASFLP